MHKRWVGAAFTAPPLSVLIWLLIGVSSRAGEPGTGAVTADQRAPRDPKCEPPAKPVRKATFVGQSHLGQAAGH